MAEGLEFTNEVAANVLREVSVNLKNIFAVYV
jgi:hypothetical protein